MMQQVAHWLAGYGYLAVGVTIALESLGLPLPGEAALIAVATYAATTHRLDIWLIFAACAAGATLGSTAGYVVGRKLGYWALLRYGRHVGVTERRMKIAQLMFRGYGGAIICIGRFLAVFRSLAALFAGANHMPWPRFLGFNAAGAILWAALYGFGTFYFANEVKQLSTPIALGAGVVAAIAIVVGLIWAHGHEAELEEQAQHALEATVREQESHART